MWFALAFIPELPLLGAKQQFKMLILAIDCIPPGLPAICSIL